jgi:phosphoribosylaminoimidazolecarboxamide formyltransferase/IMP cyclohydrolase
MTKEFKRKKRALISVYYKDGIEVIGRQLVELGWEIVSSGGTASYLQKNGIKCIDVAELTKYPAILGHRVVTLHPAVHGGILAKDTDEHRVDMQRYDINFIDMVIVDVYPVWEAIAKLDASIREVVELTDIGGPTMLRAAAKNHERVSVICDPVDRNSALAELKDTGTISEKTNFYLAKKVFRLTSRYDDSIHRFFAEQQGELVDTIFLENGQKLAYAENRDRNPAFLYSDGSDDPRALTRFKVVSGDPSYISMADGSQILEILCLLSEAFADFIRKRGIAKVPYIVIAGKHGNPCGAAFDWNDPAVAICKALMGDPTAVMGGEVITNFAITPELGQLLFAPSKGISIGRENWGLDIIFAPEFSDEAVDLLGRREKRRLLSNPNLTMAWLSSEEWTFRPVRGGFLKQKAPRFLLTLDEIIHWTGGKPLSDEDFPTLLIAWVVCWRASSNTVTLAKDNMLVGIGCGQQDRIACVRLCLERANRAGHNPVNSVFASDGFFPYAESGSDYQEACELISAKAEDCDVEFVTCLTGKPSREFIKSFADLASFISKHDRREGPELLADAGCSGGVVPADGKNLELVKEFFRQAQMNVGFVEAIHRGFSKH